jgi:tape measure domain-containing protein
MSNLEVGVRLTADGRGLVGEAGRAREALGGLSGEQRKASADSAAYTAQVERQNTSLGNLKGTVLAAAGAYISYNAAIAGGRAVIDAALANERLNNTLKVGLGSQQAATQEIAFLREEADKLGLQFATTSQQYANLTAASKGTALQGQATRDIFLAVAKASTVMGLSADQTGGALLAIEQMISKGTVSAEELRGQLGERLPGAFQIAARAINVTTQELGEMLQKGEVTAEQLLPALAAELERTYGAEAQAAAQGLNAQINRLDNSFTDLKLAVADTGLIDLLSDGIQLAERLTRAAAGAVETISAIPGLKTVVSAAFGGGILPLIFGKDANAATTEIKQTTAALEQAEQVISKITRPGSKPEPPKEFMAALKREAAERKKIADQAIREAQRAAEAQEREYKQRVDSSQRFINALIRETDEIGKNAIQKRLMAAATEAANAPTKELAAEIMASAQAWAMATQAQDDALANNRQMQEAAAARQRAETQAAQAVQQEWNQTWSTVESTARISFTQFAAHGVGAMEAIGKSIQNGIIDLLYQLTLRKWVINIGASLGLSGGAGSALASGGGGIGSILNIASLGSSALNLFSTGFGATSLLSNVGSMLPGSAGSFFAGMGVSGTQAAAAAGAQTLWGASGMGAAASAGSAFAAAAGPAIAIAAVDQITRLLAGDKLIGGGVGKALNFVPVLGPLINGLFGRGPLKQRETTLSGTIGAAGFIDGSLNTDFRAAGGLFRSNKNDFARVDAVTGEISTDNDKLLDYANQLSTVAKDVIGLINDTTTQVGGSLKQIGADLALSTEGLDNFSHSINLVSEKGKMLTDEQIAEEIGNISDKMARSLLPNLDEFAKRGETALQTVSRLGLEFSALAEGVSVIFGQSGQAAKDTVNRFSIGDRSEFIDAAGGIENFRQKINQFFGNLDDSDKLTILQDRLKIALNEVGVNFIPTMDQFNAAMRSGDLSMQQFIAGLDLQGLIKDVNDLRTSLGHTIDASTELPETLNYGLQNADALAKKEAELAKVREANIRVTEKAARREAQKIEADARKAEIEAAAALKTEIEILRQSLLLAGDAAGAVSNELRLGSVKQADGKFVAGDFNAAFAVHIAKISGQLANNASADALRIQNVGGFINTLLGNIVSDEVVKPVYLSIRDAIVDGSGDMSNAVRDAVNGFAKTIATEQARINNATRATGLAAVLSASADLSFAKQGGFTGGQFQFGRDVLAYGQAIEKLDAKLQNGIITADEYAGATIELERVMGANAKLLGDTEAQLRRINDASLRLAQAGIESIGFYFSDIAKQTEALNKQASQSGESIAKTTEAIGRLNSVSTVLSASAAAVIGGLKGSGPQGAAALAQELRAGSQTSKAQLIGEAASIAAQVLTTADAAQIAKKLAQDGAFEDVSSSGLRDISLLLDGLNAFDAASFENAFLRINNALISGSVTQEQYNVLFNTALDTFEGLNDSAGGAKSALGQLRDAARSAADELLLDRELSTLNSSQSLIEAQRQFSAILSRAQSGDTDAAGGLLGSARNLIGIARGSVSTQADYNVLFGRTVNQLRSIETIGPSRSQRLDVQPVVEELKLLRKEVNLLRQQNNSGNRENSRNASKTRKQLESWSVNGMPATEGA